LTARKIFAKLVKKTDFERISNRNRKEADKMATREENIKKINDELEKLSDKELEQLAGGRPAFINDSDPEKYLKPIIDSIKSFRKV